MIQIHEKQNCCGCTACASACPKECIKMVEDDEGFIYPHININDCIKCNLCERVCPMNKAVTTEERIPETYVVRDQRKEILSMGTSGSVFTSIMEVTLAQEGVVYGVIIDTDKIVKHIRVDSLSDPGIKKIPGSKYVRSEIRGVFQSVREDLEAGKLVCFSGVPCQIAGLKGYLRREYENLITVDLICHGNPSPLFWKKYIEYLEMIYKSEVSEIKFRNKTFGYHSGTMRILFENGKLYFASARTNFFLKAFFSDLCSRPSCYDCHFKKVWHKSDLTLYDSWHAGELAGINDDDRGYTNVIVQSKKGKKLLKSINTLELYQTDTLKAVELDGIMVNESVKWNKKREKFLKNMETENIKEHCLRFMKVSLMDVLIEKMKRIIYFGKFSG